MFRSRAYSSGLIWSSSSRGRAFNVFLSVGSLRLTRSGRSVVATPPRAASGVLWSSTFDMPYWSSWSIDCRYSKAGARTPRFSSQSRFGRNPAAFASLRPGRPDTTETPRRIPISNREYDTYRQTVKVRKDKTDGQAKGPEADTTVY